MINSKKINIIIAAAMIIAIFFTGVLIFNPSSKTGATGSKLEYASKLFDKSSVMTIDIKTDQKTWDEMLKNAMNEEYISCDVTVNGKTYKSVGVRPKGNSSLQTVASDSTTDRFSFKIEFDHYIDGQTCEGLNKLAINNIQADSTYMKEYLSYEILDKLGIATPLHSYANIKVNGKAWGLYLAVETVDRSFAQRVYGSDYGKLYKPEGMGMRGNGQKNEAQDKNAQGNAPQANAQQGNAAQGNAPQANAQQGNAAQGNVPQGNAQQGNAAQGNVPQANAQQGNAAQGNDQQNNAAAAGNKMGGPMAGGSGGTNLKYTDDNVSSYSNIFNNAVFDSTTEDYKRVIKAIKNINSGTELENYLDVDSALRYIAANTFVVNLDSYFSNMKHNYYLYEKDGKLTVIPWDYNLAFGGFQSSGASSVVNFPIDTPLSGATMEDSPLVGKLLEVQEYKERYHKYLTEIIDGYINNGSFSAEIDRVDKLINDYVKNDATAFYTYDEYTASLPVLKQLGELRAKSIDGQLKGTIPSTTDGQKADATKLIDASTVNLTKLGTMGGGQQARGNDNQNGVPQGDQGNQGNQGGPGGMGKMPDMQVMKQVFDIIGNSDVKSLSDEQITKIKALGITDEQLEMLKNRPSAPGQMQGGGMNGAPGQGGQIGAPGNSTTTGQNNSAATMKNTVTIAVSAGLLVCGLVFVIFFRRRRK